MFVCQCHFLIVTLDCAEALFKRNPYMFIHCLLVFRLQTRTEIIIHRLGCVPLSYAYPNSCKLGLYTIGAISICNRNAQVVCLSPMLEWLCHAPRVEKVTPCAMQKWNSWKLPRISFVHLGLRSTPWRFLKWHCIVALPPKWTCPPYISHWLHRPCHISSLPFPYTAGMRYRGRRACLSSLCVHSVRQQRSWQHSGRGTPCHVGLGSSILIKLISMQLLIWGWRAAATPSNRDAPDLWCLRDLKGELCNSCSHIF